MKLVKVFIRLISFLIITLVLFTIGSNIWVIYLTKNKLYEDVDSIPFNKVGLVLGTSKKLTGGSPNPYFSYRIDAAIKLFEKEKVKHFILSGDNETRYYNEPMDMQRALIAAGIPDSAITLDYAGFRTLDSVVRCKKIFGQDNVTIITQQFHSFRAIFIADYYDLNANAFIAKNLSFIDSFHVLVREFFARPKAIIDLYLFDVQPKFLGDEIHLNV